jgi:pimeloyl-ACP methyl ester carboxylesterase
MGAGADMYGAPWRRIPAARYLDWPSLRGERSLRDIAERIVSDHGIVSTDVPCGVSLGGIVALEIAELLRCDCVILVSSAVSPSELNRALVGLAQLAHPLLIRGTQALAACLPGLLPRIYRQSDPRFVAATCRFLRRWKGYHGDAKILRVHGDRDRVIRCPREGVIIPGAGHLTAIAQAPECAAAVERLIASLTVSPETGTECTPNAFPSPGN